MLIRKGKRFETRVSLQIVLMLVLATWFAPRLSTATVFINEIAINPPGSLDDLREYIELCGVPGRKLDGYAIAFLNGGLEKYYQRNSIPPLPDPKPEIDEFFSLDGLTLGPNGLLVIGLANSSGYPELLADTNFHGPWIDLWNGALDIPNRLSNDGSNTVLLIRRRPGRTQADPLNPGGLRWAKGLYQDFELIPNVIDPQDNSNKDQWGNGVMDRGQPNGLGGVTKDVLGATTPDTIDDIEIVDEVSYESGRGWEYDTDDRKVDLGSSFPGLPERRVHAIDDPQGFTPDSLTRVDYRISGPGWVPIAGATGEMGNGRNWQDTATEQWIRGENDPSVIFTEDGPELYYWNDPNPNPDSIQPYMTNVPRWLNDGVGADYNFLALNTYRLYAGRVNQLAIPFIPGDVDRDGDCDSNDITKLTSVFGDDDWIFSNGFPEATYSNDGNPALQNRPWDLDTTGDNGIEPSDLQWVLNFQGSTTGRVVGRRYDSTTPAATGVHLNSNAAVQCTVTYTTEIPSGRLLNGLQIGDLVHLTVRAQVTGGARTSPAEQTNGVSQFVHDLALTLGSVVTVDSVTPQAPFIAARPTMVQPILGYDRGVRSINGYTTGFASGVSGAANLYRVTLRAIGLGTTQLTVAPAAFPKFVASTPRGLKVARTNQNGNPSAVTYPVGLMISVTQEQIQPGNCDGDPQITAWDYACFEECLTGPGLLDPGCELFDMDDDQDVDLGDVGIIHEIFGE